MLLINPYRFSAPRFISNDADVVSYVLAVESADGQQLESGVISAYDSFITGCKSDGIWSAIKSACILAGARTLDGALVPLVGDSPTNLNFVAADYDRELGLQGNGSTKCLNTNRRDDADPQDNHHFSLYATTLNSGTRTFGGILLSPGTNINSTNVRNRSATAISIGSVTVGFRGVSRETSLLVKARNNSTNYQNTNNASSAARTVNKGIFSRNFPAESGSADCRISYYSIGESLNLALLDTRVSTLMADLAAAI